MLVIRVRQKTPETTNPFKNVTDKYLVAKALIAGETDRKKMQRELGVRVNTIYDATADLTGMAIPLAIHEKKENYSFYFI